MQAAGVTVLRAAATAVLKWVSTLYELVGMHLHCSEIMWDRAYAEVCAEKRRPRMVPRLVVRLHLKLQHATRNAHAGACCEIPCEALGRALETQSEPRFCTKPIFSPLVTLVRTRARRMPGLDEIMHEDVRMTVVLATAACKCSLVTAAAPGPERAA